MVGHQLSSDKREADAQARAALIGATVHRFEHDGGRVTYLVTRWGISREFDTLQQVEVLLNIFGAPGKGTAP